jgi:hypothetical protein
VIPTLRGVGLSNANNEIQIDRYSKKSDGVSVDFLDTLNRFKGWKTIFTKTNVWIEYSNVDFGKKPLKTISAKVVSETGGTLQIRTNSIDGPLLAEVKIPKNAAWKEIKAPVMKFKPGVQNLFVVSKDSNPVEVDWIKFQ